MTLSEIKQDLLDVLLNIEPQLGPNAYLETLNTLYGAKQVEDSQVWEETTGEGLVVKADIGWVISAKDVPALMSELESTLANRGVTRDKAMKNMDDVFSADASNFGLCLDVSQKVFSGATSDTVVFADGEWNGNLGSFCEDLIKQKMMFRYSSASKKHTYRVYVLRRWPYRFLPLLRDSISSKIDISTLDELHWKLILVALVSNNSSITHELLSANAGITSGELRERISHLRGKRLVNEESGRMIVPPGLKDALSRIAKQRFYPNFKNEVVSSERKRMQRSTSALWAFATVKRVSDLPGGEVVTDPFPCKRFRKTELGELEKYLNEMQATGLVIDIGDSIVILSELVQEVERWLRSSINQSLTIIPMNDRFYAAAFFRDLFTRCEEYVKVQDPYVGETTFSLLDYIPAGVKLILATGLTLGDGEDNAAVISDIERFRSERRGNFTMNFIGDKHTLAPAFHERFIISKTKCWQIGNSLLNVGGPKETTVTEHSISYKEELVEPAFDRWLTMKLDELDSRNKIRLDYGKWKEEYGKPAGK